MNDSALDAREHFAQPPDVEKSGGGVGTISAAQGSRFAPVRVTLAGDEVVKRDLLDPLDPLEFKVSVAELPAKARFAASIIAFLPDGSTAARTAVATRPS